ncbi:1,4-alpha-glucan branching protein GlgB [Oceanotoga teriensis]|uniref:1,4-alpha-glucan branching enzyme GlgB n=1 Tax=Oceanotoga teriensis TaxID=515440 RepID=A0AA45C862_9BACT|nr:1,4-alpha-glucan branching protein GlgB [Oceanotoga teriensis]MDO7976819.1 1,4-alpha-glucan branching protein GlgB [Oceanotoga teriensis]PWJ95895.1 1,4-alpha-glucan branching enzyme [Oceanotoga teriensis]
MPILRQEEIKKLVSADYYDPFYFLGIHKMNKKQFVIRTLQPFAEVVQLVSDISNDFFKKIDENGLFEIIIDANDFFEYELLYTGKNKKKWQTKDPYSFLPVFGDLDKYLFKNGTHYNIYEKLGAHVMKIKDVEGTLFSVWAPNAKRVSVVGSFNGWDGRIHQMRVLGDSGVWEIFIPNVKSGDIYKYEIKTQSNDILLKSDPYAFFNEMRPANASVVFDINDFKWKDSKWMKKRSKNNFKEKPMNVYEVHAGSWKRKEENNFLNYKELADDLVVYLKENNFTHIELMPISEHPLDMSWGYQITGYFAPSSRFGTPKDFMYFVDKMHRNNIGVILDWVPGHFPKDEHSLGRFDGTALYEHKDPRLGEHIDWGTYIFNYGRNEVSNFLISNALFWAKIYHIDGLRVDAVASMLYLDYSRKDGEWIPNKYGGRENLEAIEFFKHLNSILKNDFPGFLTIAEESTSFPGVTQKVENNGLGFDLKWNMGWMHDSLEYFEKEPIYRKYHQNEITFSMVYSFSENFILSISHDEVVYGKKSMIEKMPGDLWQKFANLRLYYTFMYSHPGKKLLFMGSEFAQYKEWDFNHSLDWHLLNEEYNYSLSKFFKDITNIYLNKKPLYEIDFDPTGFEWIDINDSENSIISFLRKDNNNNFIVCIFNFTPVIRENYRIGVPKSGIYKQIFNSDKDIYSGSNWGIIEEINSENIPWHGKDFSINITLPPLSGIFFELK